MKKDLLAVKELAAELRMNPKSIQRAYYKEEIPVQWLGRMARFNLAKVRRAMERAKSHASSERHIDTAGRDRRREPAARTAESPPVGDTGALPTGMITGGLRIP